MTISKGTFDTVCTVVIAAITFFIGRFWGDKLTVFSLFILFGSIVILWIGMMNKGNLIVKKD